MVGRRALPPGGQPGHFATCPGVAAWPGCLLEGVDRVELVEDRAGPRVDEVVPQTRSGAQRGAVASALGSCQPSSPATTFRAADGPHVPGRYSAGAVVLPRMGSTTRQASSTPSSLMNRDASPRIASPSSRSYGVSSAPAAWRATSSTASPTIASPG